jgi:hypothetical protein
LEAVAGDTAVETDEAFTLSLSNPSSGLVIGIGSANGTIINDDTVGSGATTGAEFKTNVALDMDNPNFYEVTSNSTG